MVKNPLETIPARSCVVLLVKLSRFIVLFIIFITNHCYLFSQQKNINKSHESSQKMKHRLENTFQVKNLTKENLVSICNIISKNIGR